MKIIQLRYSASLFSFDLPSFQFHRGGTTEDGDRNKQFASLVIDFLDNAILAFEWAVADLDGVASFEADGRADVFLTLLDLAEHAVDLTLTHGDGLTFGSSKANDSVHFLDEIPTLVDKVLSFIKKLHVDDDVSGEEFTFGFDLLTLAVFFDTLLGNEHLVDNIGHFLGLDEAIDAIADFLLLAGENVDDIPLLTWFWDIWHDEVLVGKVE